MQNEKIKSITYSDSNVFVLRTGPGTRTFQVTAGKKKTGHKAILEL